MKVAAKREDARLLWDNSVYPSVYRSMDPRFIRNFSIIAHIDHGKSTLADRLLEFTGALSQREMMEQVLDTMDLERERGITIKAHAVRLNYKADDGNMYQLNLIDTPGHVDFTYEVSRSLQACEGALLVVDASQGVEAQTLANTYLALNHDLEIIPVINKIDLPSAEPERIREQIEQVIGLDASDAVLASAKNGIGIKEILEAVVQRVPAPKGDPDAPLRALIFDSWFDPYRGVIILTRVVDGTLRKGQKIRLWSNGSVYEVEGLGFQSPKPVPCDELTAGEAGFVFANIKTVSDAKIGDTITDDANPRPKPLPGFQEIKPMVFAGLYPVESHEHGLLARCARKAAAERQRLQLRAGKFGRARLRFPLRLSRPAASGNRPGAAGARVQDRPDHHRAGRALPRHHHRRRSDRSRQSAEVPGSFVRFSRSKSRSSTPR